MSRRRNLLMIFSLLVTAFGADASVAATPLPAALSNRIDRDVRGALQRFGAPGAAVMVVRNGQIVYLRAFGLRDVARRLPIQPDTYFEIGSITKQFTAACILQLQEAGKLNIDRPLADYLPDAPHAKEVTLRELLAHTSGLHDYFDGPPVEIDRLAAQPASYRDLIGRIGALPLDFPPGSKWSYSNTNYLLLGKVIEAVSGESYPGYLRHHILDPLHLTAARTMTDEDRLANFALGYRRADGRTERASRISASWAGAAGFLVMRLQDLAKWDAALTGGQVVTIADYRQMATSVMTTANGSANYGLGLFVESVYGQPRIGHTGGSNGSTTADEFFPRQDVRIIAFTNLGNETPEAGEALTNIVFADLYPAIAAEAQRPAPGENAEVTRTVRAAFRALQTGKDYAPFADRLKQRLSSGLGAKFVDDLAPYGRATAEVFKGVRRDGKDTWYDYVMQFGPGVSLSFAVKLGPGGRVSGVSIG